MNKLGILETTSLFYIFLGALFLITALLVGFFLHKSRFKTPFHLPLYLMGALFILISLYFLLLHNQNFQWLVYLIAGALITILIVLVLSLPRMANIPNPQVLDQLLKQKTAELAKMSEELAKERSLKNKADEEIMHLNNFQKAVQLSSIVSIADRKGNITYVNDNFERISGYSEFELIGQNHRIINSGFHEKSFWINMWKTIAKGNIWREDVKNKAKDGSYYWVDTFIIPFLDDQGQITQYLSIRNDITNRKTAEYQLKLLNDELGKKVLEKTRDLQHINDELNKMNRLMKSVQNHVHIGVWEIDFKNNSSYWSDKIYEIYRIQTNTLLSIDEVIRYYHPDDRNEVENAIKNAIDWGSDWDLEARIVDTENRTIWIRTAGVAISEDGKVVRLKGLIQNIDQQKKNEEQLKNSQAIVNLAIEAGEIGVFKWNIKTGKQTWNKYMHEHFGCAAHAFHGTFQDFISRIHPDDTQELIESIHNDFNQKSKFHIDFRVFNESQHLQYIETSGLLSRDKDGQAEEMTGICINVTDRKETEVLLREKEEQFRLALEYSAIGMALQELDGKWLKVNKALSDIVGYTEHELIGNSSQNITHPDDLADDYQMMDQLVQGIIPSFQLEKRYIHKNNEEVWVQINKSLVRNDNGAPRYFIVQIQDIRQRKQAELEIRNMNTILETHAQKLEFVNRELESFTYSVSHDLRAPLRSINGYAQILKEDYAPALDDEGNEVVDVVIRNAQRMGQLIDDLLEFSRIGRKDVSKGLVDMTELVTNISNEMVDQENGRIIKLNILPLESVRVDLQMMRQVWINLISNALKYTRKNQKTVVEIGCEKRLEEICFYIKDNGVGFNMNYVNKLFEVFQRLHRNDEFEGTGVGLALVRRIVDRHGGKIWAEAKEHEGASFFFTIPKSK